MQLSQLNSLFLLSLLLNACGTDNSQPNKNPETELPPIAETAIATDLSITPNSQQYLNLGESIEVQVTGHFDDGRAQINPTNTQWQCSPENKININGNHLEAKEDGLVQCQVKWQGLQQSLNIEITSPQIQDKLQLTNFSVKEVAGVYSDKLAITAVFPLPYGQYQNLEGFSIEDSNGTQVAAQFSVINRWWLRDKSIRHLSATFIPKVEAYSTAGTGISHYHLAYNAKPLSQTAPINNPANITQSDNYTQLKNGLIEINIQHSPFSITTPAGKLKAELIKLDDEIQSSFAREDIKIEIEEQGPIRARLKLSAPTIYLGEGKLKHGWAIRLSIFTNSQQVKLDYQLQNSAINETYSAPLYFKAMNISIDTELAGEEQSVIAEQLDDAQELYQQNPAVLGNEKLSISFKNFWQTWPNGLKLSSSGDLSAELWPSWSRQYDYINEQYQFSEQALYWLADMRHVVKELMLDFAPGKQQEQQDKAKLFQFPPVAVIPLGWYQKTQVTLNMGGYVGRDEPEYDADTSRVPSYSLSELGWNNFYMDLTRKIAPSTAGSLAKRGWKFMSSQNPADYYQGLDRAMGELNIMPQWLAGYSYERDFEKLKLTPNPYSGSSWRRFEGHGSPVLDSPYLSGTSAAAKPRDDEHGWFYHIEDAYFYTANPWIKDWYVFVKEFRRTRLYQKDPVPDMWSRAVAHSLNHALQAYRITGDTEIISLFKNYFLQYMQPGFVGPFHTHSQFKADKGSNSEAVFQAGYLMTAMIDYLEEVEKDEEIMAFIERYMHWNLQYANFSYGLDVVNLKYYDSRGVGTLFIDPQVWYAIKTNNPYFWSHVSQYLDSGVPFLQGERPWENVGQWQGQFEGRLVNYYKNQLAQKQQDAALSIKAFDLTMDEGLSAVVVIALSKALDKPYHIEYRTQDNTARAGEDYTAQEGELSFAVGELIKVVQIPLLRDEQTEPELESFRLILISKTEPEINISPATIQIRSPMNLIMIDDKDPTIEKVGNWTGQVTGGESYAYTSVGDGSRTFSWPFSIEQKADYEIYTRWPNYWNGSTESTYQLPNDAGPKKVTVNQLSSEYNPSLWQLIPQWQNDTMVSSAWYHLGDVHLSPGKHTVTLSNLSSKTGMAVLAQDVLVKQKAK